MQHRELNNLDGCAFAQMVAWESAFLLQCQENEVFLLLEAADVV